MKKEYIVFQVTPKGDKIDLGYAQQLDLIGEIDEQLKPSLVSELVQFSKLELEEIEDDFTKMFNLRCEDFCETYYKNEDGSPKLFDAVVVDMEEKRLVVKYDHFTGVVYFHNLLCFRGNNYDEVKGLVGQTIPVYFLKKEEKDGTLLFSQTCTFTYDRKDCNLENLEEGQTIECIPTTYIFKHGVFVNFNQGTGLVPVSKIDNWDSLHSIYPIGQPVSLVINKIDAERKRVLFYPKVSSIDSEDDSKKSSHLIIGKRYQVKILWIEKTYIKVSFENGIERIPKYLLPQLFRKYIIKLKCNTHDLLIDTVAIENDGKKMLSAIEAVRLSFEALSMADKAYGLKSVEVVLYEPFLMNVKPHHLFVVRWKGLYGSLIMDDETFKVQGYEATPQCGSFIDLRIVGYNPEMQVVLKPKEANVAEEKVVKEILKDPSISYSVPASILADLYPIYVTPGRVLVSDILLTNYEDKNLLVKLNLPDLSFLSLLMKWIHQDLCKLCVRPSEEITEIPYLVWNGLLYDVDIHALANHEVIEVIVQSTSKNYVIFYVGKMVGCIFNQELIDKGMNIPLWGDRIKVKYSGRLANGDQHLLFQFVSVSDTVEKRNVQLPLIRYNLNSNFSILKGFVIACKINSFNDDSVVFNPPNQSMTFIMDQAEWDETGASLPQQLGFEATRIFLGIQQVIDDTGVIKLSRKMLFTDPDYKWFDEEEPDFPLSLVRRREKEWQLWRDKAKDGKNQMWLVWRVQKEWAFFRNGNLILPVKREEMDYALGVYSINSLEIGKFISFRVKIDDSVHPYKMLSPIAISEQEYTSRLPQIGEFVLCQVIKKGSTEWKLAGQQWIGTLPIDQIPEGGVDIDGLKSIPIAVVGYNPATREVVCSFQTVREKIKEGVILENCIVSKKGTNGMFVTYNGLEIPVEKKKSLWKQKALNNLIKGGEAVTVKVKKVKWSTGRIRVSIIGNKTGIFSDFAPEQGLTVMGVIKYDIDSLEDNAYIVQFENGGTGLMDVKESMEIIDKKLRYNAGEQVEVEVIGYDQESGLPLLSFNRCHPIQFDSNWFVHNQSYEGVVVKFNDVGVVVKLTSSQTRIFIPIRLVYNSQSDYKNRLYKKGSLISVIYKGGQTFVAATMKAIENPPTKGDHCKLTILSFSENGINTWDEEECLVWVPKDEICFKKEIDVMNMSYKKNQILDGYYYKKGIGSVYMIATLKPNRDLSAAYPIGTCLEGMIHENPLNKKHYIVDLNDAWGALDVEDVSWYSDSQELVANQCVKVRVVRKPLPGNILSVSMLSPDVLGPIGSSLEGVVEEINNDEILISVNGIKTIADRRRTQIQIGIDNFGRIRLHVGDKVLVKLESVNISYRDIRVIVEKLIQ